MNREGRRADDSKDYSSSDAAYGREWTAQERDHLFPINWPYRDLPLRTRNCPWCGFEMVGLFAEQVHPMAMCLNDECRVMCWDPSKSARDNVHGLEEDGRREENE